MKDAVKTIIGKRIKGVVTKKRPNSPYYQLFLIFSDDTFFEFYTITTDGDISCAGGIDKGGIDAVRNYLGEQFITLESCDESIADRPMGIGNEQEGDALAELILEDPEEAIRMLVATIDDLRGAMTRRDQEFQVRLDAFERGQSARYECNLPKPDNYPVSESIPESPMTRSEMISFLEDKAEVFLKQGSMSPKELLEMVDEQAALYLPKNPHATQLIDSLMAASELGPVGPVGLREWIGGMSKENRDELTLEAVAEVMNRYSSLE